MTRDASKLDRRQFLERTGATAGGLWLASEIISVPTVFAGASCVLTGSTLGTSQWQNLSWAASGRFPALSLTTSVSTFNSTPANGASGTITPPAITGFGVPNQRVFYFDFSSASPGGGASVTFTFSAPVYNVTFRVYDIDRNIDTQNYIDRVAVSALGGATVSGTAPGGSPSGNGTIGSPFVGTAISNNSTSAAYGDYTLSGRVTSFTLTYTNAITSGTGSRMIMGIGDLTFCR